MPAVLVTRATARSLVYLLGLLCAARPLVAQVRMADSSSRGVALDSLRRELAIITGAALNAVPSFTLEQALQGKVAGLRVDMNDGAPWSDGQMQIRGPSTLFGDPSPLVIVDGVQITNTFSSLQSRDERQNQAPQLSTSRLGDFSPSEVASVEILKGSAATALYGARGANGVILVSTRRALARGSEWRAFQRVGTAEAVRLPAPRCFDSVSAAQRAFPADSLGIARATVANGGNVPCRNHYEDLFSARGVATESGVQWSGGAGDTRMFASAVHKSSQSSVPGTSMARTNMRVNADQRVGGRVQLSASLARSSLDEIRGAESASAVDVLASLPSYADTRDRSTSNRLRGSAEALLPMALGYDNVKATRTTATASVAVEVLRSSDRTLTVQYSGGIDLPEQVSDARQYSQVTSVDSTSRVTMNSRLGANENHAVRVTLNTRVANEVPIAVAAGVSIDRQRFTLGERSGFRSTQFPNEANDLVSSDWRLNSIRGVFVRASTALLDDRLTVDASFRSDQLTRGSSYAVSGGFPGISVAYRMAPLLDRMSLAMRGSMGQSGGLGILGVDPSATMTNARLCVSQPDDCTVAGFRFERRTDWEAGADLIIDGSGTALSYTGYRSFGSDVHALQGFGLVYDPVARKRVSGHELSVQQQLIRARGAVWTVGLSATSWSGVIQRYGSQARTKNLAARRFAQPPIGQRLADGANLGDIAFDESRPTPQSVPRFDVTFRNEVRVGPLSLHAQFDSRFGSQVYSETLVRSDALQTSGDFDQASSRAGVTNGQLRTENRTSVEADSVYLTPNTFVRLRELSVIYGLPLSFTRRAFGSLPLAISVRGRNLALWTRSIVNDPEFSAAGTHPLGRLTELYRYPTMRQVFVGLDLGVR
jgi:TonB-dependent starch-binding outer membrane protein SusC